MTRTAVHAAAARAATCVGARIVAALLALAAAAAAQDAAPPPPAAAARAVDTLGDPLPPGAIARLGTNRLRHPVAVSGLAFAPDGRTLFSRGVDGEIRVWDSTSGALLRTLAVPDAHGPGLGLSRDGRLLALGVNDGEPLLLDAQSGTPRALPRDLGSGIAISPDGRWLARWGRPLTKVSILSAADGRPHRDLDEPVDQFARVAFSADGSRIALLGGALKGHEGPARGWRSLLTVRDPDTGATLFRLEPADRELLSAALSPDGQRLCIGDSEGSVRLLDVSTGAEAWRVDSSDVFTRLGQLRDRVNSLAISLDGSLIAVVHPMDVAVLDATTGQQRQLLATGSAPVQAVAFAPDGKLLATGSRDQLVRLFDVSTGRRLAQAFEFDSGIARVVVSPDGTRAATIAADGGGALWSLADDSARPFRIEGGANDIAFTSGGDAVAVTAAEGGIRLLSAAAGAELGRWAPEGSAVRLLAFSRDGRSLATVRQDGAIDVFTTTGSLIAPDAPALRFTQHVATDITSALAFSPDGAWLATGSSNVALWNAQSGELVRTIKGTSPIAALSFSPDGTLLATANADRSVRLLDPATGELRAELSGHGGRVNALAFSPDGRWLASADSLEPAVRVWDLATRTQVALLAGHESPVLSLAFVPDGHALISAGFDSAALVWALPPAGAPAGSR